MTRARAAASRVNPWEVLHALRALPLVAATARDKEINGGDAVEALCEVRELLDAALAGAPVDGAEEE